MIITKIEPQKKNKGRYNLYIDGEFKTGISEDVIVFLNLRVKQEIDEDFYNEILKKELYAKAKSSALKHLQKQLKTEKEIRDKLRQLEYEETVIESVVEFLKSYNFIDDFVFAKAYIHDKITLSKHSLKRIQYDLKRKGVSAFVIEDALNDMDEDVLSSEIENLVIALSKKKLAYEAKEKYSDYEIKQKLMYFFSQKGYAFDKIKKAYEINANQED